MVKELQIGGTSNSMILVPLLNPKFAIRLAAWLCELRVRGTRRVGRQQPLWCIIGAPYDGAPNRKPTRKLASSSSLCRSVTPAAAHDATTCSGLARERANEHERCAAIASTN
jgi:hypothetical protein